MNWRTFLTVSCLLLSIVLEISVATVVPPSTVDVNGSVLPSEPPWADLQEDNLVKESSEFPPNVFTPEQLKHGAVILYFIGAIYSFAVIGIVCGDFFLPSIDCICTDLNLTQDIAAATFMSFATTAPELFIILIATFLTQSDIGLGAVVGGGMFNILGVATIGGLAARSPIKLDWWPLYRDSLVYMFAPIGLSVVVSDGKVTLVEATGLILYYFFYFVIMFFSRRIRHQIKTWIKMIKEKNKKVPEEPPPVTKPVEKLPPILPTISLTFEDNKNSEVFIAEESVKDSEENDDGSFKAYFVNYEDSISLRRISACSNSSWRSSRSRRKSDRSINGGKSVSACSNQTQLVENLHFGPQKLPDLLDEKSDEQLKGPASSVDLPAEEEDEIVRVSFLTVPEGNFWNTFTWFILWPSSFVLYYTIPDCRFKRWRKYYPITFIMCIFWIGISSYFGTWMISVVGETIEIPQSVMGLTFLALGGSMPEAISTFIMSRQGEGGLGFSNSLGGNTMDICLCLGVPWLIKTAMKGEVKIDSQGLQYNSVALVLGIIVLLTIATHTKFHMNKKMGIVCCVFYFIFIVISILIELNVIEVSRDS